MFKILAAGLFAAMVSTATPALAQDASLHDVYEAVNAGRLTQAQEMMDKVLKDHPNSAKAHYVEAEIQAKQGNYATARTELDTASRLAPGLPFAKPQAVNELNGLINSARAPVRVQPQYQSPRPAPAPYVPQQQSGGISMGLILLIGFIIVVAFLIIRAFRSRPLVSAGVSGPYGVSPGQPYGVGGGVMPGMMGGGGMGSGILGGLATGAAVGVGMAAGEELIRHMVDHNGNVVPMPVQDNPAPDDDLGGQDFGVSGGGGSWDDNSSGGGDSGGGGGGDWN